MDRLKVLRTAVEAISASSPLARSSVGRGGGRGEVGGRGREGEGAAYMSDGPRVARPGLPRGRCL